MTTYLSDLSQCQPAHLLTPEPRRGHWRTLAYETDTLAGTMLMAGPETVAPNVVCPLGVEGWHEVHFGVYSLDPVQFLARLSAEETFSMVEVPGLQPEREPDGRLTTPAYRTKRIAELQWKTADLTGQDLVLGQRSMRVAEGDGPGTHACTPANIAYVKLVPLPDEAVEALRADRARRDTRRLFGHNDAHGPHQFFPLTTAEELRRHIEAFRDSDFSRLYWEAGGGDELNYFTQIGRMTTRDTVEDFAKPLYRYQAESWRHFRREGIDPFGVALEHAHAIGMEFHAGYRVAGFHYPPPNDHFNAGETFYKSHPHLRGMDRDGNVTPRISYAYPETRQFVLSVLREVAAYGVDGIALLFNRRPPLLDYEPPLVESFRADYGEDPRQRPADDVRWLAYRARTLTQFMREVRAALGDNRRLDGKRIEVTAVVAAREENLRHAIDVETWIEEGLVDTIVPYSSLPGLDSLNEAWTDMGEVDTWVELVKGTQCRLALNIMPRHFPPEGYYKKAHALYERGVDHLFFWDADARRAIHSPSWRALRRLGHRDEIAAWVAGGSPPLSPPSMKVTRLGDWDLSFITPG